MYIDYSKLVESKKAGHPHFSSYKIEFYNNGDELFSVYVSNGNMHISFGEKVFSVDNSLEDLINLFSDPLNFIFPANYIQISEKDNIKSFVAYVPDNSVLRDTVNNKFFSYLVTELMIYSKDIQKYWDFAEKLINGDDYIDLSKVIKSYSRDNPIYHFFRYFDFSNRAEIYKIIDYDENEREITAFSIGNIEFDPVDSVKNKDHISIKVYLNYPVLFWDAPKLSKAIANKISEFVKPLTMPSIFFRVGRTS